jgi:hypothetical protein
MHLSLLGFLGILHTSRASDLEFSGAMTLAGLQTTAVTGGGGPCCWSPHIFPFERLRDSGTQERRLASLQVAHLAPWSPVCSGAEENKFIAEFM